MKSIQIKLNNESDDYTSDLQDYETGSKKDANSLLVQELITPDMMFSKCSKIDTSSNSKRKRLATYFSEEKNEDDCPRYAKGHKLSFHELYCLSKN